MLRYFGKYKLMYWSPVILLACAFSFAIFLMFYGFELRLPLGEGVSAVLFCLFLVLWANLCNGLANRELDRRLAMLNDRCTPEAFLKANQYSYRKALKTKRFCKPRHRVAAVIMNLHIVAMMSAGRHEETMQAIELLKARTQGIDAYNDFYAVCLQSLAATAVQRNAEGDIALAKGYLEQAKEFARGHNVSDSTAGAIIRTEYRIEAAEGKNLQVCLDYFTKLSQSSPYNRAEAVDHYVLASIYRQLGDTENERVQLEIVTQKAPGLYVGKLAACRLAEMSAQ